ncbi:ABC transporter permease [Methylocucumis oryzae]|uniref:ABC transporter permease n=1 Tax=Methylocucumis oryzae TaxID=1632867 RepID=UPI000A4DC015|nr:ABC transporter permease [Methylocucumis oryzae]
MLTYLLRRVLLMVPTLLGITIVVFTVMAMSPGGISAQSLIGGMDMKPQEKQALLDYYNKRYGLDQPAPMQYLRWLNNVSPVGFVNHEHGEREFSFTKGMDLGTSFQYGRPVADILAERIPITLLLNVLTIPVTYVIAILVGVYSAKHRGGSFDVASGIAMLALWSIPTMLAGVLLLGFFANVQYFNWFPTAGISSREALDMPFLPHWDEHGFVRGFLLDRLWHLILPVLCLSYGSFAALAKINSYRCVRKLIGRLCPYCQS